MFSYDWINILYEYTNSFTRFCIFIRLPDDDGVLEAEKVVSALVSARSAYEKLRQRAEVLKVAREQGWTVAKELSSLQDQEENPLLKKAMKNVAKR